MKVVANKDWGWFLVQHENRLFLDALCGHSFVIYSWPIELNETETKQFGSEGQSFIDKLAHEIHYSAPAVINSNSRFISRKLKDEIYELVQKAILDWNKQERAKDTIV